MLWVKFEEADINGERQKSFVEIYFKRVTALQINCASVFHYLRLVSLCFIFRLSLHPMLPTQLVNIFVCDELNLLTYCSDWLCYLNESFC